jgi:hypothetical protein
MASRTKAPRQLVSHRTCAAWFDMTPRTWRRRYESGMIPIPQQVIGIDLLYDREVIDHRLATGQWPRGTDFVRRPHPEDASSRS